MRILFVCTGNSCRSPMAELYFDDLCRRANRPDIDACSAGICAWDGDPERKFLAYRTRLGQAVLNSKVGDTIDAPGGRKCVLAAVRPLSEAIIAELDA